MKSYRNILVINLKHIGDVLVATPVFTALKEAYPDTRLSVLVDKGTEDMVTLNPVVDEVLVLDRAQRASLVAGLFRQASFPLKLRKKHFDLVLELSAGDRGAFLGFLTGAKERVGFAPHRKRVLGRHCLFTRLVRINTTTQHMVDYNLALARSLGIEPLEKRLSIFWSETDEKACTKHLLDNELAEGDPYVVMHPTSRWLFKAWNSKGYALVCDHIAEKHKLPVVITSAPDEKEKRRIEEVFALAKSRPIDLSGQLSLKQLACCISKSLLFIGVDSAPMHIAAAVNTPAIVLFGPSGDHMWGPWGDGHIVIKKGWSCQPCGRDGCNGSKVSQCLEAITPEEVIYAVDEKLIGVRSGNQMK